MTKREKAYSSSTNEGLEPYDYRAYMPRKLYGRLLDIAEENNIVTFDISEVINFVISKFPVRNDQY